MIAALCNQKGGVGKTTTAINLARAAHLRGLNTLVIDADPQATTATSLLGAEPASGDGTLAGVLSGRACLPEAVVGTAWERVDVLASGADALADRAAELVRAGAGRQRRLAAALDGPAGYDLVLLDCPPALDVLTTNALAAADRAVVVTMAAMWSSDGITRLLATIEDVQRSWQPRLDIAGVIVNAFEGRTRRQRYWLDELRETAPAPIWEPPVPRATWVAEAAEAGKGLDEWGSVAARVLAETYDGYLERLLGTA